MLAACGVVNNSAVSTHVRRLRSSHYTLISAEEHACFADLRVFEHAPCKNTFRRVIIIIFDELVEFSLHFIVDNDSFLTIVDRDSSVVIATSHSPDGTRIEPQWRRDSPHPSIPALGPINPQWVQGHFPWGKAAGAWR